MNAEGISQRYRPGPFLCSGTKFLSLKEKGYWGSKDEEVVD